MSSSEQWEEWLKSVPAPEQGALFEVLKRNHTNGVAKSIPVEHEDRVAITRTPTEDLLVTNTPPYLDIFHLHDIFKQLAFKSNILLKGPKGDGKSLSIITYAAMIKSPLIIQECSEDTKKTDLMGTQTLLGDETIFTLGCIPAAIDTANECGSCILLLEELSALTPQTQKQLNAVTDFRRQCSMPFLGKTYKLREGAYLWVVGSMNPSVYGGTYDLNEDLKSRFEEVEVTYPDAGQELQVMRAACKNVIGARMPAPYKFLDGDKPTELHFIDDTIIRKFIKLAGETRQNATGYALSTRDLVRIIETAALLGVENALQLVLCKFEGDEDKNTVKKRMNSIFDVKMDSNYWR